MSADSLSHKHRRHGFRCDVVDSWSDSSTAIHPVSRDDAAVIIGLTLAHAREGRRDAATVPGVILDRLVALADQGEPACRMVHAWLTRQTSGSGRAIHPIHRMAVTTAPAEMFSATAVGEGN